MQSPTANDQKTSINSTRQPIALKTAPTRRHSARKIPARVPKFHQISTTQKSGEKCGLTALIFPGKNGVNAAFVGAGRRSLAQLWRPMAGAEEVKHLPLLVRPEKAAVFISTHDKPGRTTMFTNG